MKAPRRNKDKAKNPTNKQTKQNETKHTDQPTNPQTDDTAVKSTSARDSFGIF